MSLIDSGAENLGTFVGSKAKGLVKPVARAGAIGAGLAATAAWKLKAPIAGYAATQGHLGPAPQAAMMFSGHRGLNRGAGVAAYQNLYEGGADHEELREGVGATEHNPRRKLKKAAMFGFGRKKNRRRGGNNKGSGRRPGPKNSPKESGGVKKYKFKPMDSLKQNVTGAFGKSIGTIGAVGAVGATVYGAHHLYKKMKGEDRWSQLTSRYPELNTKSDRDNYNILLEYAPSLTLQPRVAGSYLIRAKEQHLMPHEFIKDLVDIESKRSRTPVSFGSGFAGRVMK